MEQLLIDGVCDKWSSFLFLFNMNALVQTVRNWNAITLHNKFVSKSQAMANLQNI